MKKFVIRAPLAVSVAAALLAIGLPSAARPLDPIDEPVPFPLPENPVPAPSPTPTPTPPPAPQQYRISQNLDVAETGTSGGLTYQKFKAYTRFERYVNGQWKRYDTRNVSIACYVNGNLRDAETESNASLVDLTFTVTRVGPLPIRVDCVHQANDGEYRSTTGPLRF